MERPTGTLYVVATPIGNLEDLSARARRILASVAAIYCEDTRVTGKLAAREGISTPRISCHTHNERARAAEVARRLEQGEDLALVSDAGTPGLSDPGAPIVAAAALAGARVVVVPGPSAGVAALSISGFPAVPHRFEGFLPPRSAARRAVFERVASSGDTTVMFEAPHRLAASLADAAEILGERPACLCREMTKIHEEVIRGTVESLAREIAARGSVAGECVLVIAGAAPGARPEAPAAGPPGSPRELARRIADLSGAPVGEAYRWLSQQRRK